jgi:hypothetical protein
LISFFNEGDLQKPQDKKEGKGVNQNITASNQIGNSSRKGYFNNLAL